jgi:hypothetical protein
MNTQGPEAHKFKSAPTDARDCPLPTNVLDNDGVSNLRATPLLNERTFAVPPHVLQTSPVFGQKGRYS